MENADYTRLEARIGRDKLSWRLLIQARKEATLLHQGEGLFRIERFLPLDRIVDFCLKVTGLGALGHRNFLALRVVEREWFLPRLPRAFDRFRLLQLSDVHLDLDVALTPVIQRLVQATPHDAAVVTGDFRDQTDGDYGPCLREMERITGLLSPQRWGILGNHDAIEMVPALEAGGLPVLLNEVGSVRCGGETLWIGGIDDPHFYKTHDLERVRAAIPPDGCSILLSHSPETFDQASRLGFDLQLSGHTHGGQLCLPGGIPVVVPCKVEKQFILGRWSHGPLQGYTSPGTGSCGVAARLNCPPEITLHILRTGG